MSGIAECPRKLFWGMLKGSDHLLKTLPRDLRLVQQRNFKRGYGIEKIWREMVKDALLDPAPLPPDPEGPAIVGFDPIFRGHVDGIYKSGQIAECKSVAPEKFQRIVRVENRIPPFHYWQVQAYMRYSDFDATLITYFQSSTLEHATFRITQDDKVGDAIEKKARLVLACYAKVPPGEIPINGTRAAPACECGRCKD